MASFEHVPHPRVSSRRGSGPVRRADQFRRITRIDRLNARLAVSITNGVGTMGCAYGFAALALVALPSALQGGIHSVVSWIAQTFLQLVLLSIILVGQRVAGEAADRRAEETWKDTEAILHEVQQLQAHLAAQDLRLRTIDERLLPSAAGTGPTPPVP